MRDYERLKELLKKAIVYEEVTLSSGKKSNYYIDGKMVTLSPEGAYLASRVILEKIKGLSVQAIGGLTLGADPLVAAVASLSYQQDFPINAFIVRKDQKNYGRMKQIEGLLQKGSRVVLIDDVTTTGASILQAARTVKALDCEIILTTALVDREEGAKEALETEGIKFEPLFRSSELF